ncbi:MAG: ABC transporter permease [Cyclobacteriaceae bacterium]
MKKVPPNIPDRFLRWFCRNDLLEFIRGDLHELYTYRLGEDGKRKADLAFYWDVLRFFRISNIHKIKNSKTQTIMLQNYLKVGFRSLKKNWANSLINISGLSLSVGCAITTFLFADFFLNLNSIHSNRENIYQVVSQIQENNTNQIYGPSPMIIGERLEEDFPEIQEVVRVQYKRGNVKFGKNVFRELVLFADPSYLDMFDFPMEIGNKESLTPSSILISSDIAKKYFGETDPMGKRIDIKFDEVVKSFDVGGIFGEVPLNTTFRPQIMLHLDYYFKLSDAKTNWIDEAKATFISLKEGANPHILSSLFDEYKKVQNEANSSNPVSSFALLSFPDLSSKTVEVQDGIVFGNHKEGTIGIAVTGILLILFACLNYVNIAIASATTRLKEIGVRKVMGGTKGGIAQQFLTENFMICAFAMIIGAASAYYLLLPGFNMISPIAVPFSFSSVSTAVVYFVSLFLFLGLLSGSYPAFYISRFQTLKIFRGEKSLGGRNFLSRILLTAQFFLAFVTILGCFIFTDNANYVKQVSWGYDPSGILSIPIGENSTLEALRNEAEKNGDIFSVVSSKGHLGVNNNLVPFDYLQHQFKVLTYDVEPGYLQSMDMTLSDGRFFEEEKGDQNSIVVNGLFVEHMDWADPIGESIVFEGKRKTVIGVITDVYHVFFDDDIQRPMVFTAGDDQPNFLIVKSSEAAIVGVNDYLASKWKDIAPFDPYVSYYQSDNFDSSYNNVDANIYLMMTISVLTIFLSCLGLYGLLAFTLQSRLKEFGIRKVLGASRANIIKLVNKEFIWIVTISLGLGAPLGIVLMNSFVESFFKISKPFSMIPVLLCFLITIATIVLTVFVQIRRVTRVNPAAVLKGE